MNRFDEFAWSGVAESGKNIFVRISGIRGRLAKGKWFKADNDIILVKVNALGVSKLADLAAYKVEDLQVPEVLKEAVIKWK